jgi:hypothetical protein
VFVIVIVGVILFVGVGVVNVEVAVVVGVILGVIDTVGVLVGVIVGVFVIVGSGVTLMGPLPQSFPIHSVPMVNVIFVSSEVGFDPQTLKISPGAAVSTIKILLQFI